MSELSVSIWRRALQLSDGQREAFQGRLEALTGGLQHNVQRMVTATAEDAVTGVRRDDEATGRRVPPAHSSGRERGSGRGRESGSGRGSGSGSGSVDGHAAAVASVGGRTTEGPIVKGTDTGQSGHLKGEAADEEGGHEWQEVEKGEGDRAAKPESGGASHGASEGECTQCHDELPSPAPALRLFGSNIEQHKGDTRKESK